MSKCAYREYDLPYVAEYAKHKVVSGREWCSLVFRQFPESAIAVCGTPLDKLHEIAAESLTKVAYTCLMRNAHFPSPLEKKKNKVESIVCCSDSGFLLGIHLPLEVRLRVQIKHLTHFLLDDEGFEKDIKYMPLVQKIGNVCGLRFSAKCTVEELQELLAECVSAVGIHS